MIAKDAVAIGITGPFGSGSTTGAQFLKDAKDYMHVRLSKFVKEEWERKHPGQSYTRTDLQNLGNDMRKMAKNPGILVERALGELESETTTFSRIAFDGIRNLGEIEALRARFGLHFYLFAFECQPSGRWDRVKEKEYFPKGLTEVDFTSDNDEDRDQENVNGQQVQLCVDQADVLINNESTISLERMKTTLRDHLDLATGATTRYPTPGEMYMNLAYSCSHGSKCLKRQVGAVIVAAEPDKVGEVVAVGFNENPLPTSPCVEEPCYGAVPERNIPGKCFRDIERHKSFVQLANQQRRCPRCGQIINPPEREKPPWLCSNADCSVNLEKFFWPERAMTLCTAVHAEVRAILAGQGRTSGATLYSTTFPCFQCAEKIAHVGIPFVVYTEPYPDVRAARRLEIAGIRVGRFQGVRSSRFDEIFGRARPYFSELRRI